MSFIGGYKGIRLIDFMWKYYMYIYICIKNMYKNCI